jgi:hypothetical protein
MADDLVEELLSGSRNQPGPVTKVAGGDITDELLGGGSSTVAKPVASQQPDNRSLFRKGYDAIAGRQDPAYAGLKTFDEEMFAEGNKSVTRQTGLSAFMNPDDAAYGDIMKDAIGDRFIGKEKDKHGYDIIVFKGTDGATKKAYVNKPGLDADDVGRGVVGALPFVAAGGGVGAAVKGAGVGLRALAQGAAGAGTSLATDAGAMAFGSEQGVDPWKAALVGGAGAVGEAAATPIGALWRRFVTVPGLFDRSANKLTDKGVQAAKIAGIDPDELAGKIGEEFAKAYAKSPKDVATELAKSRGGIQATRGQRLKDPERLLKEEGMRRGIYGEAAKAEMRAFDEKQAAQVRRAAVGEIDDIPGSAVPAGKVEPGVATTLAPGRLPNELDTVTLGGGIQRGLQSAKDAAKATEREAWDSVTDMLPKPEALKMLPDAIGGRLGALATDVDQVNTPIAHRMATMLESYMKGTPQKQELGVLGSSSGVTTIDAMRRRLGHAVGAAKEPADRMMAGRIYEGFNDWIDTAAEQALIAGKPEAAAALRSARGVSREVKDLLAPRDTKGQQTAAARILGDVIDKSDSAEGVVARLFGGGPSANIQRGEIEALTRMKALLGKHGDGNAAQSTWNDVRAAYWMRLVQDKKGDLYSPKVMLNNIKTALKNQQTVVGTLYDKPEIRKIAELVRQLETITYKDPNPSGSSYGIASFAKEFFKTIFNALGLNSAPAQLALGAAGKFTGLADAAGKVAAKRATSQTVTPKRPNIGGLFSGAGAVGYNNEK